MFLPHPSFGTGGARLDGACRYPFATAAVRTNHAPGRMVGAAARHLPGSARFHRLRDLGGLAGQPLRVRPVSVAVLFAVALRRHPAQLVRALAASWMVAGCASVFAGTADPVGARRFPVHLLLLPRRVLQGVLGRSALVHGWRAAEKLPRRTVVPAHLPERPPLFSVSGGALPVLPLARRLAGAVVRRSRDRSDDVRDWGRNARARRRIVVSGRLHARLPFASATWSAATSTSSRSTRRDSRSTTAPAASTAGTAVGPGRASFRWRSPISTSASARWAS